ncbi:MAG: phosphate ABC transporter permease subunit PstC [Candidatus Neomarinimicrobiota bacterium]|nr:MAG: phosphate ABC transporter permease subunit PstC [Candidatus Neomarinimicrobiota bacterium]
MIPKQLSGSMKERWIRWILALSALIAVVTTLSIIVVLGEETLTFFRQVSLWEFFTGTRWEPLLEPKSFGILPLLSGTLLIVVGSGLLSLPVGLITALYLSEYASERFRNVVKPLLEILAGIPTVVYGYFALTFVTPLLRQILPSMQVFNAFSAALVVGIMILPMVVSLCDDALRAVPRSLREGGYALGATTFEVSHGVVVPSALSGIMASFVLALSRAFGETMAVTLAAGATPNLTWNPLESIQTMTAYIVQVSLGDTPAGGIEYQTIFAVGTVLFVVTLFMNILAHQVMHKFREEYE